MPTDETRGEDLAGIDQAGTRSQTDDDYKQRFYGIQGKFAAVQNQLTALQTKYDALAAERDTWTAERQGMLEQSEQLRQALEGAEGMIGELTGKWNTLSAQAETLNAQLARQQVILKYPQLISDPVVKLVQASQLAPEDLEATLFAMADSQQQLVKQAYQEAQTGATASVSPATAPTGAKEEQAKSLWNDTLAALEMGDYSTFRKAYKEALRIDASQAFASPPGRSVIGR